MSLALTKPSPKELCLCINSRSPEGGLFQGDRSNLHPESRLPWRISPEPFRLTAAQLRFLEELGPLLLSFYKASNLLYSHSVKGLQPPWVHHYLDLGKSERVVELGRMNRFKTHLPLVIRPDLLVTDAGYRISELDSIPGGMGFTGQISQRYAELACDIVGGSDGLVDGFYDAIEASLEVKLPTVAIVVSDESDNYREEMQWLAAQLRERGRPVHCRHPSELHFDEDGLLVEAEGAMVRVDAIYRFFELFDLANIPKAELAIYFAKKNAVRLTPPPKAFLEEKMGLAFLHHPLLQSFWQRELGAEAAATLQDAVPKTWIVDPRPAPPHTVIADLQVAGSSVNDWKQLKHLTKRERELVLKPSGFSELASESRDVAIGHDMSEESWGRTLDHALEHFPVRPYVLQRFHKSARTEIQYYDFESDDIRLMRGRALLRPYYYVVGSAPRLAGVQAIVCPSDKKILHGMADAVLAPCSVDPGEE